MLNPILQAHLTEPLWAVYRPWLEALSSTQGTPSPVKAAEPMTVAGGSQIAVLPIVGPICHRTNWMMDYFGGVSIKQMETALQSALGNPSVSTILLYVDSPGGTITGVPEFAAQLAAAAKQKKIVAVTEGLNASAAYWISSAASELWATPSSDIGAIGVYNMHFDYSQMLTDAGIKVTYVKAGEYKAEGNPDEPLTDGAREHMQMLVDDAYAQFVGTVARHRGVSVAKVEQDYGQGRVYPADQAKSRGLIDHVGTLSDALISLGAGRQQARARAQTVMQLRATVLRVQNAR